MSSSTVPASARSEAPAGAKTASADSGGRGVMNAGALLPAAGERGCSTMPCASHPPPCPS